MKKIFLSAVLLLPCLVVKADPSHALRSENPQESQAAILSLSQGSFDALQPYLKDEHGLVRLGAFTAAKIMVTQDPKLKTLFHELCRQSLNDQNQSLQFMAAYNLALSGDHSGEPQLMKSLDQPHLLRRIQAAEALAYGGTEQSVGLLITNLRHENSDLRRAAIHSLRIITGQNFGYDWRDPNMMPLRESSWEDIVTSKREALADLEDEKQNIEPLEYARRKKKILSQSTQKYVSDQNDYQSAFFEEREGIIRQWQEWYRDHRDQARSAWLITGLDHDEPDTRANSITALGELNHRESGPRLIELLSDSDYRVRLAACRAIAQLRLADAIPDLITLMGQRDEQALVVADAAFKTLKQLTQNNLIADANYWRQWWDRPDRQFTLDQVLPHHLFEVHLKAVQQGQAHFLIRKYAPKDKQWVSKEYWVSVGETLGQAEEPFSITARGWTVTVPFDMRPQLLLENINQNTVTLTSQDPKILPENKTYFLTLP